MESRTDQSIESNLMDETARRESIRRLVQQEYQAVYRFAYRLSGSHADAEDLTQQAFLTACRKLEQLRSPDRPRPWLFTIVRNRFLKTARQQCWELPGDVETWASSESDHWPEEIDEEQLQRALKELPETYRTPVLFYYFEELSYKEIADILEVPIGTIMSRLARGKQFLRNRLKAPLDAAIVPSPVAATRVR